MGRHSICFFLILFVCHSANSQDSLPAKVPVKPMFFYSGSSFAVAGQTDSATGLSMYSGIKTIPSSYYTSTIGFFCTKELQLEKAIKVPVKFRLGSVAYTDKMEGKGSGTPQIH